MSSPRQVIGVIRNKTNELDSKIEKFERDLKKNLRVDCRESFIELDSHLFVDFSFDLSTFCQFDSILNLIFYFNDS